jgi:hypothetical protein
MMLKHIPDQNDLSRLYFELSERGAPLVGEKTLWSYSPKTRAELVALAIAMSRYDAHLFGVLVGWLRLTWQELNPLLLRKFILKTPTPQVWCVIAGFLNNLELQKERSYYFEYVSQGIHPVTQQLFYKGQYPLGGKLMERAYQYPLSEFLKWGFLCSDRPVVDPFNKISVGRLRKQARIALLKKLIGQRKRIQISDYLESIDHCISRQQALLDLQNTPSVQKKARVALRIGF